MEKGGGVAVLDEVVLETLGQLQGKYDPEFVARIITMFMETALVLLIRLNEGVVNRDLIALHHASHELKSCSATIGAYSLAARCAGSREMGICRIRISGSRLSASNIGGQKPL